MKRKDVLNYALILFGSFIYGIGTVFFIFPASISLGGTGGIAVVLSRFLPLSAGNFSVIMNSSLIVIAFFVLGKSMAVKNFIGSALTTVFIGVLELGSDPETPIFENPLIMAVIGAVIIAVASAILFFVGSSSGGTDIIALIVQKYFRINIGRALLITDFVIVIAGGIMAGLFVGICSFVGFLIKTLGIDFIIGVITKKLKKFQTYRDNT